LANWLIQEQITVYDSVPSTFRRFVGTLSESVKFPHLRLIALGGEPVYKRDVDLYKKHFSDNCLLCVRLAGTEPRVVCSYFLDQTAQIETHTIPVGYAVEDKEILLLDVNGKEVAVNQIGEITIKSRYLAVGYWRNPELTRAAFQPSPQGGEERIYRTGDLGRMRADGCLEHLGRKDSQVKIRGHRVEVGEVEMALLDLTEVKEVAVSVKEDRTGRKYLAAYFVPNNITPPSSDVLRAALAKVLPDYMIPSYFVTLESLPLTPTGKVDYRTLPEPSRTRPELQTAFLAPRTALETELQQIWQETLDIHPIGVQDNFFDLGGDSLAAVEVLTRIEHAFHSTLPPDVFIQAPTIERLASILSQQEKTNEQSSLVAIQPHGSQPPFFCVPGYMGNVLRFRGLGPYFAPDQPLYGLRDPRLLHKSIPFARIEDIVPRYVETLLTHQSQGPYYVGGYSFGCLVALEIAQQLQKAGHQVGALIFLDLPSGCHPQRWRLDSRMSLLLKRHSPVKAYKIIVRKIALFTRLFTPGLTPSFSMTEANMLARDTYVPKIYPGRVIFFQTRDNQDAPYRWENLMTGGIEVHEIPGTHETLLQEPHVQIVAEKLKACLAQLQMRP
jgi:thioesterase domain-containing protein/acyl carrier protein